MSRLYAHDNMLPGLQDPGASRAGDRGRVASRAALYRSGAASLSHVTLQVATKCVTQPVLDNSTASNSASSAASLLQEDLICQFCCCCLLLLVVACCCLLLLVVICYHLLSFVVV